MRPDRLTSNAARRRANAHALIGGLTAAALLTLPALGHPTEEHRPGELPSAHPDRIVVTWAADPASSFSLSWRTAPLIDSSEAELVVADASPQFNQKRRSKEAELVPLDPPKNSENVPANYHTVTFEDLEPDTLYAYRVGHDGHWSEWLQVKTASNNPEAFSFIYFGDAQNNIHSRWSRAIRTAYSHGTPEADFMLHAGDLINRAHRNLEWGEWFEAAGFTVRNLPNIAVPGNHEYTNGLSVHWRPQFEFPKNGPDGLEETAYYIDYQGMRIVALDSNRKIKQQAKWLERVLEDNPNRWTVITHHHPIFSSGKGRNNPKLREHWKPLYDEYGVDLVLQGHDHTYARGRVENVPTGANVRDGETGTVYVNSVSGPKMYRIREQRWNDFGAKMERAAENTQLFQLIDVDGDQLDYRAYTVTGELYDAFRLRKGDEPNQANRFIDKTPNTPERTHENTGR